MEQKEQVWGRIENHGERLLKRNQINFKALPATFLQVSWKLMSSSLTIKADQFII